MGIAMSQKKKDEKISTPSDTDSSCKLLTDFVKDFAKDIVLFEDASEDSGYDREKISKILEKNSIKELMAMAMNAMPAILQIDDIFTERINGYGLGFCFKVLEGTAEFEMVSDLNYVRHLLWEAGTILQENIAEDEKKEQIVEVLSSFYDNMLEIIRFNSITIEDGMISAHYFRQVE